MGGGSVRTAPSDEQLMRQIMNYDAEFRREEVTAAVGSHAKLSRLGHSPVRVMNASGLARAEISTPLARLFSPTQRETYQTQRGRGCRQWPHENRKLLNLTVGPQSYLIDHLDIYAVNLSAGYEKSTIVAKKLLRVTKVLEHLEDNTGEVAALLALSAAAAGTLIPRLTNVDRH